MKKEYVHNHIEGKILIKDSYRHGDEEKYNGCQFYKHNGEFLFTAKIRLTEFEMDQSFNGEIKNLILVYM